MEYREQQEGSIGRRKICGSLERTLRQTESFLRNGNGTGRTSYNGDHAWRGDAV